jgi:hypothetical protein
MTTALLDINDCNLQLWHGQGHVQSPGYALLRGGQYLFGNEARAAARVQPLDINTRFWWQLGMEPLQPALGPARHTADLAHAHLLALHSDGGSPGELVLAVPGSMQRDQLALLLGIVGECPFDAIGLFNRSVALASLHAGGDELWHLELQLHQALLSRLARRDDTIELVAATPLPGCGLLPLQERLVVTIAAAFVRQTRFDPRRKAASEQALYDALPAALARLRDEPETNIEVEGYRARLGRRDLLEAPRRLFDSARECLGDPGGATVLAEPLAALLPGLAEAFPGIVLTGADDLPRALAAQGEHIIERARNLSFITALPALVAAPVARPASPAAEPAPEVAGAAAEPTHLLDGATARALDAAGTPVGAGWEILRNGSGWTLRAGDGSAEVNGAPYRPGQQLAAGDTLRIGAARLTLIEVLR